MSRDIFGVWRSIILLTNATTNVGKLNWYSPRSPLLYSLSGGDGGDGKDGDGDGGDGSGSDDDDIGDEEADTYPSFWNVLGLLSTCLIT